MSLVEPVVNVESVSPESTAPSSAKSQAEGKSGKDQPAEESFEAWKARQDASKAKKDEKKDDKKPDEPKEPKEEPKDKVEDKKEDRKEDSKEPKDKADKKDDAKDSPKTIKYKVDGEEVEVALDKVPELLAKAHGSDKRFQEASQIRKEAQEFVKFIKTSPIEALKKAGVDFEDLAINYVHDQIQYQNMSPEQREAYDAKKQLSDYQKREAEAKAKKEEYEKWQAQESERIAREEAVQSIEKDIISALDASELPKTQLSVSRIAYYLKQALIAGKDVTAKDVIPFVVQEFAEVAKTERKQKVEEFKANPPKPELESKPKQDAPRKKRISSIYDMLE